LEDFLITDPFDQQVGNMQWYTEPEANPGSEFIPEEMVGLANFCEPGMPQIVYALQGCDTNDDNIPDEWVTVATHTFQVFPEIIPPVIQMDPISCDFFVNSFCNSYQILFDTSQLFTPYINEIEVEVVPDWGTSVCSPTQFTVEITPCNLLSKELVYIPNAFSPNDDGVNDYFSIYGNNEFIEEVASFSIYSRWGELLFQKNNLDIDDLNLRWDGSFNGTNFNTGVFLYHAQIRFRYIDVVEEFRGEFILVK
jgi:gliding motility-associated-like protein